MNQANSSLIGIDVSDKKLDFLYTDSYKKNGVKKVDNRVTGFEKLEKLISKDTRLVLEATGVYHYNLCSHFYKKGHTIYVVNPRAVKYYGMAKLQRDKTDKVDAKLIYDYGQNMVLSGEVAVREWKQPSEIELKRQQLLTIIQLEKKHLNAYSSQLHSFKRCNDTSDAIFELLQTKIESSKELIKDYEKELNGLNSEQDIAYLKLIQTIPGIGPQSAMVFLHILNQFRDFETAKQVICYLGTNPREYESGSSIKRNKGISKMGAHDARKTLYMAALSAKRYNIECGLLYKRLREKGKKHKQAMIAVVNKLVRQAFGISKSGEIYNANYQSFNLNLS